MMAEIKRHVCECIFTVFRLGYEGGDGLTEETLVLCLRVVGFARELYDLRAGVVAGAGEFD